MKGNESTTPSTWDKGKAKLLSGSFAKEAVSTASKPKKVDVPRARHHEADQAFVDLATPEALLRKAGRGLSSINELFHLRKLIWTEPT